MATSLQIELMCANFAFADWPRFLPPHLRPVAVTDSSGRLHTRFSPAGTIEGYTRFSPAGRSTAARTSGRATGTIMPVRYAPKTYGAYEMMITERSSHYPSCEAVSAQGKYRDAQKVPLIRAGSGIGRLPARFQYQKKIRGRTKCPPGRVDKFVSRSSTFASLEKHAQTDGERWAEEMLEAEILEEMERADLEVAEREEAVIGEVDEGWELVDSSPSERLLAPIPQPRTVIATDPVSKRAVALPFAPRTAYVPLGAFGSAHVGDRHRAAGIPDSDGGPEEGAKVARERARERFLKGKAERAAKLQRAH